MRVLIRGVIYESVQEAADQLGVTKSTIWTAIKRDRLGLVGMGSGRSKAARESYDGEPGGRKSKPVTVGGKTFRSYAELSLWLGRNRRYVATKMSHRPDTALRELADEVARKVLQEAAAAERRSRRDLDRKMSAGVETYHIMGGG